MSWLKLLQEEQMSIIKGKQESGEEIGLNWEDTKNMPITSRVIQETLRVASILSFTFREATEDVEYQGNNQLSYNIRSDLKYEIYQVGGIFFSFVLPFFLLSVLIDFVLGLFIFLRVSYTKRMESIATF